VNTKDVEVPATWLDCDARLSVAIRFLFILLILAACADQQ